MKSYKIILGLWAITLMTGCIKDDKEDQGVSYVKEGDTVPAFTVSGRNGTTYSTTETEGKITMICFFATWCSNCHRELPKIQYVFNELTEDSGFQLVTIGREETLGDIKTFWEKSENQYTMPYYEDPDRKVYDQFASATVPRIYLIGRDKKIVEMAVGETSLTGAQWLSRVKAHLEKP